jgi:hypothetical protein
MIKKTLLLAAFFCACTSPIFAQTDSVNIDELLGSDANDKVYANNAFKSTRVVIGHSMEMLGEGVLDFRILHRFGTVNNGLKDLFGLDYASMRMSFDYGIKPNLMIGMGRSTFQKEMDGFVKYRIIHQHTGSKAVPVSVLYVAGITAKTGDVLPNEFSNRLGYYHQLIIGRKFNNNFSFQLSPTFLHQNYYNLPNTNNDKIALGIGGRYKLNQRFALMLDAFPIVNGATAMVNRMPASIGVDIETGGHVFQLHFSNAKGMNERAFLVETNQEWTKGQFQFGFNLSRVFTIKQNKNANW